MTKKWGGGNETCWRKSALGGATLSLAPLCVLAVMK